MSQINNLEGLTGLAVMTQSLSDSIVATLSIQGLDQYNGTACYCEVTYDENASEQSTTAYLSIQGCYLNNNSLYIVYTIIN